MKNIQGQSARKSRHTISRVTALRSTCSILRQENMSGTYARRTTTITASMLSGWITPSRITVFTISIITAILKDRRSPAVTSIRSYTAVSSMIRRKNRPRKTGRFFLNKFPLQDGFCTLFFLTKRETIVTLLCITVIKMGKCSKTRKHTKG